MQPSEIIEFRAARKWSQERLADELGVNVSTIWRWENGKTPASGPVVKAIERLVEQYPASDGAAVSFGKAGAAA